MRITTLAQFEAFLKTRIPMRETLFVGDIGLYRAEYFMSLLGDPQNKIKVIHVAGTSGKGSTCHLVSHLIKSQGFNVGMSISPHVFDIRERMQINNKLPSEKLVLKYFNQILPTILKMENCKFGMPTFFEINVALAYYMFAQEKLEYAVMETGLGGTLDATNTVTSKNKICLITKLGLDHTEILGKTIAKISEQKAGIINGQQTTVNIQQAPAAQAVIEKRCNEKKAKLYQINQKNYSVISSTPRETIFDFNFSAVILSKAKNPNRIPQAELKSGILQCVQDDNSLVLKNIKLGLIGIHQAENCSLALACLAVLSQRDKFEINKAKLRSALEKIIIPGRLEIRKINHQKIIIDGAHNPQKMEALTSNLAKIYPSQKFTFVVAFKKGKDFKAMLKKIMPLADQILLTQFSTSGMDNHWSSIDNQEISSFLQSQNFNNFKIIPNKYTDILHNVSVSKKPVVITGSLYLIGSIYPYFSLNT